MPIQTQIINNNNSNSNYNICIYIQIYRYYIIIKTVIAMIIITKVTIMYVDILFDILTIFVCFDEFYYPFPIPDF